MSKRELLVVEVDSSERGAAASISKLVEEGMGAWQSHYAMACFNQGYCRGLIALSGVPLGVSLFYSISLEPGYSVGVIYYIVVKREYRGQGIGRVLVLSTEHLLEGEGSQVIVATTRADNHPSRKLFSSLGYDEVPLYSIEDKYGELFTKLTCSYEDDVAFVKSAGIELSDLMSAFNTRANTEKIERLWYSLCYRPWRQTRRSPASAVES